MKQWIALLFCAVLLMTVACPVWAEDSTTTIAIVETTTEPTGETTTDSTTTTEPTESTEPTTTTTTAPNRYAVFLTIAYENGEIIIRAKDANGQPVRNAPVKVAAGSEQFSGYTNDAGVATFPMAEEPAQIICSTEAFKGTILYYDAASASVILHTPTSTAPTTTEPITTPTQKPSTSYITGTSVTWTTSDPLQGNVTVTEIITSTTQVEEEEEEELQPAPKKSPLPDGWALALMIMGGVLLVVAAVVLCLFLFRAPRVPAKEDEEEEAPAVVPAPAPAEEPAEETEEVAESAEEAAEETAEQPAEEESTPVDTAPQSVSLEDLFR